MQSTCRVCSIIFYDLQKLAYNEGEIDYCSYWGALGPNYMWLLITQKDY